MSKLFNSNERPQFLQKNFFLRCVTNDNHVWFRRGVKGETAGISEDAAIGSGWVEMVGNISMVRLYKMFIFSRLHQLHKFFT